jgi:hypothetical protein
LKPRAIAAIAVWAALAGVAGIRAAGAVEPTRVRVSVTPPTAQLGERLVYRGTVVLPAGAGGSNVRWSKPESDDVLVWGNLAPRYVGTRGATRPGAEARRPAGPGAAFDTALVEIPLQIFDTGLVSVAGLQFEIQEGSTWKAYRLPVVRVPMVPVLTAGDSTADLRPLRGPLAAPWWERVPWLLVIGALSLVALAIFAWRRWRRRRPQAVPAAVPAVAREDSAAEALRELAALRRLGLIEAGRFGDHAFALTRILKRYLERTKRTPRPGDTTPELVHHLVGAGLDEEDIVRIEGLMRFWDRLKFARAEARADEARAAEGAVEALIRGVPARAGGEAA